jgi:hypothetical protein
MTHPIRSQLRRRGSRRIYVDPPRGDTLVPLFHAHRFVGLVLKRLDDRTRLIVSGMHRQRGDFVRSVPLNNSRKEHIATFVALSDGRVRLVVRHRAWRWRVAEGRCK